MIDLNNLIDLFPYYYKENDSYKDKDGKGLLEQFLNICGDYFQRYPLADMDNFLEILDINTTNIIFVNNFWKFFGELPFAQGPIIDPEIFSKTFTGFNFDESIRTATRSIQPYTGKDNIDYRSLIKYSISLFKIRGTKQFFDIMFRLYGMTVTMTFPGNEDPFLKDHTSRFDLEDSQYDKATFDNYYRCQNCSDVIFTVTPPGTLTSQSEVLSFANQVKAFIDRFVPFYINPVLKVANHNSLNQVTISINKEGINLNSGETDTVEVRVKPLVPGNNLVSLAYRVAVTDIGKTPTEKDWGLQEYINPIYKIYQGNHTYWFKPVAPTPGSTTVKVDVNERYVNSQYMIWIESPTDASDLILSKDKPKINIRVKAIETLTTYLNGKATNQSTKEPFIIWDDKDEILPSNPGEVEVDYYGWYTFSIQNYRTRKVKVYISATPEYKEELDVLTLKLKPNYLLVKDGKLDIGTSSGTDIKSFNPGVYGSEDGVNWTGHNFSTEFEVVNREGITQPFATIVDISNTLNKYHPGDTFVPSTAIQANYTFKAQYQDKESEPVTLFVWTDTAQVIKAKPKSIIVSPNPLEFQISSSSQTKALYIEVRVDGLSKNQAKQWAPTIIKKLPTETTGTEIVCHYDSMEGSIVVYKATTTHTEDTVKSDYRIHFSVKDYPNIAQNVTVKTYKSNVQLYIQPALDQISQWSGINQNDPVQNKNVTFTAKQGSSVAKFTFEGNVTESIVGSNGQTYSVSNEPGNYIEIEVNGNSTITFTAAGDTLTLNLKDFDAKVSITCNPKEATITSQNPLASTNITGSTNKNEKFRFTIDGEETIYSMESGGSYKFETTAKGTHTFTAVDDPSKVATFNVKSTLIDSIETSVNSLVWNADDTGPKSFEISAPDGVKITLIEEE